MVLINKKNECIFYFSIFGVFLKSEKKIFGIFFGFFVQYVIELYHYTHFYRGPKHYGA